MDENDPRPGEKTPAGNILPFTPRRAPGGPERPAPFLNNLPPVTGRLVLLFVVIHAGLALLVPSWYEPAVETFGFIPARYTGGMPFQAWALAAPLTYAFLHGSWTHLAMNGVMTVALGAGAERLLGGRRMLALFALCSLAGALCHFIVSPFSAAPMIGASAGISGLFAALFSLMQGGPDGRRGAGGRQLMPFIVLWVIISLAFGLTGGPGGESIAWAAHIGGFLAGFVFLKPVMRWL